MSDGPAAGGTPPGRDGDADGAAARRGGRGGRRGRGGRGGRGGRSRGGRSSARGTGAPAAGASGDAAAAAPTAPSSAPSARRGPPRARREVSAGGIVFRVAADPAGQEQTLFLLIRDSYQNWGFPKGHLERGEAPDAAALREVAEETGLGAIELRGVIETIDWYFRFRGRLIHKVCHFYLMQTEHSETSPQVAEGITACRWAPFEEAVRLVSYANAREVLKRAHGMVRAAAPAGPVAAPPASPAPRVPGE